MKTTRSRVGEMLNYVMIAGLPVLRDKADPSTRKCSGCSVRGKRTYWIYSDREGVDGPFHSKECYQYNRELLDQSPERMDIAWQAVKDKRRRLLEAPRRSRAIETKRATRQPSRSTPRSTSSRAARRSSTKV